MALAEFSVANGKFTIGMQARVEDLYVTGAVHGLEPIHPALGFSREDVFGVVVPVAGLLPERQVQNLRRLDFLVAVVAVNAAHVLFDLLPDGPSLWMPENQTGGFFLHVKQIQLTAQAAMIALFGLFYHAQVGRLF